MSTGLHATTELEGRTDVESEPPESLQRVICVSLSHDTAGTDRIGAAAPDKSIALAREMTASDRLTECVVLATCNRVEVYASTRTSSEADMSRALAKATDSLEGSDGIEQYVGLDAVEHLFRVASGLESAVLGEDQILGQVRRTFETAESQDAAGGVLSRVADAAVRAGRRARTETDIGTGTAGYGGVICRCIESELAEPPDRVLLVGAGEMARLAANAIERRWEATIDIANRSEDRTLTTPDGRYWSLSNLERALQPAEAVVTATGASEPVLTSAHLDAVDPGTPVVDLANPPDVSTADSVRETVSLTNLDELNTRLRNATQSRQETIPEVTALIDDAIDRLVATEHENRAEDTLRELHRHAAAVRESELEEALTRLEHAEDDCEAILAEFASALTGQLLAQPTDALRAAARNGDTDTIAAAEQLFDLEGGDRS